MTTYEQKQAAVLALALKKIAVFKVLPLAQVLKQANKPAGLITNG